MRIHRDPHVDTTVLGATSLLALALGGADRAGRPGASPSGIPASAPVGVWLSTDGTVRLDIRTDGTYAGKVAGRKRTANGTYRVDGATMTLRDDSGLRTPVALYDGTLEMAGHRLKAL
jgi:hypothetical protein